MTTRTDPAHGLTSLEARGLSLLVVRDDKELYASVSSGVRPLLELADQFPEGLDRALVFDRVVGGCAARVFVFLRIAEVVAGTISDSARAILASSGTRASWTREVREIRNRDNSGVCPFEMLSARHSDASGLLVAIRRQLALMSANAGR